jgi:hypothetical protein
VGTANLNLTGQWSGEYSYPGLIGPTTPFLATLTETGGRLTGTVIEPDTVTGAPVIEATIAGIRAGQNVDFTKSYGPAASEGYGTPVDYVGTLSGDGNTVAGVWSLLDLDGQFEMRRESGQVQTVEKRVAETIGPIGTG